ncbi:hypothetical protein CEXT_46581 [Caerostris extrusa]|uniref:Uncharacterized protein n=1 Tax=Caerostris extrusa TaxID=172846 RepID=A0AAV4Q0S9_CAEEX|nr:hypothetical protein CEXT_46581 [Caerostris extrusa]
MEKEVQPIRSRQQAQRLPDIRRCDGFHLFHYIWKEDCFFASLYDEVSHRKVKKIQTLSVLYTLVVMGSSDNHTQSTSSKMTVRSGKNEGSSSLLVSKATCSKDTSLSSTSMRRNWPSFCTKKRAKNSRALKAPYRYALWI